MRHLVSFIALAALGACGGGSGGGSVTTGSGGTVAVTPAAPPAPPPPTYVKYAAQTGNQTYQSTCAANGSNGADFASPYGQGPALVYTASTDSYLVSGPGLNVSFGPADVDTTASAGTKVYRRVVNGLTERLSIVPPRVQGTALEYVASFSVAARATSGAFLNYACLTGVPTVETDLPAGSNIPFARVAVSGVAYVTEGSSILSYSLNQGSTGTLAANATNGTVTTTIDLSGLLLGPTGTSGTPVSFGTHIGSGTIDPPSRTVGGSFTATAGPQSANNFNGWAFGPQAAEGGLMFTMSRTEGAKRIRIIGSIVAFRQ